MSRSRKKLAVCGICYGCNTEFYRIGNRRLRTIARRIMRMYRLGRVTAEDIAFPVKFRDIGFTDWTEPTDGHRKAFNDKEDFFFTKDRISKLKRK